MSLYQNKYRIESARLPNWDYSANGAYFITICTFEKYHLFGEIKNDTMILNAAGQFAHNYWVSIPEHFPFVLLDEFVVMPNHMHGILIIDKPENSASNRPSQILTPNMLQLDPENQSQFMSKISPKAGSISSIVRSYKNMVKKVTRKTFNPDFEWQERFHDHIIRDHASFLNIHHYIKHNVKNWKDDRFFS